MKGKKKKIVLNNNDEDFYNEKGDKNKNKT